MPPFLNQETREEYERIAIFVPARNIETWFHYSFGHKDCDENSDYKHAYSNDDAGKAAEILANDICPSGLPDDAPNSLHKACEELKRLGFGGQC